MKKANKSMITELITSYFIKKNIDSFEDFMTAKKVFTVIIEIYNIKLSRKSDIAKIAIMGFQTSGFHKEKLDFVLNFIQDEIAYTSDFTDDTADSWRLIEEMILSTLEMKK